MSFSASVSWAALTVTVCTPLQFNVVKVKGPETVTSLSPEEWDGVTVTEPVGWLFSFTVYVLVPPSLTERLSTDSVTPRVSSSAMVSAASAGSAAPSVFAASPLTLTVLSAASMSLSTAVIVTAPVLEVAPAAMVSTLLELML